jgi:hypothetical protein
MPRCTSPSSGSASCRISAPSTAPRGALSASPTPGMAIPMRDTTLHCVPAHFLHAEGNFQFYDGKAKILFSGDLGASLVPHDDILAAHHHAPPRSRRTSPRMEGFHKRYMVSNKVCRFWAKMVREMDVEQLVPAARPLLQGQGGDRLPSWPGSRTCIAASTCSPRTTTECRSEGASAMTHSLPKVGFVSLGCPRDCKNILILSSE